MNHAIYKNAIANSGLERSHPIELRPVDARMQLPPGYASYLFEEFSQCFCVEQAFDHALDGIARVMRQTLSKDTLERINQRVGTA